MPPKRVGGVTKPSRAPSVTSAAAQAAIAEAGQGQASDPAPPTTPSDGSDADQWVANADAIIRTFSTPTDVQAQAGLQAQIQSLVEKYQQDPSVSTDARAIDLFPTVFNLSTNFGNERGRVSEFNAARNIVQAAGKRTAATLGELQKQPAKRLQIDTTLADQDEETQQNLNERITYLQRANAGLDADIQELQSNVVAKEAALQQLREDLERLSVEGTTVNEQIRRAQGQVFVREQVLDEIRETVGDLDVQTQALFEGVRQTIDYSAFAREFLQKETPAVVLRYLKSFYVTGKDSVDSLRTYIEEAYAETRSTLEQQIGAAYTLPEEHALYDNAMQQLQAVFGDFEDVGDYPAAVQQYNAARSMLRHYFTTDDQTVMVNMNTETENVFNTIATALKKESRWVRRVFNIDNLTELAYARAFASILGNVFRMRAQDITTALETISEKTTEMADQALEIDMQALLTALVTALGVDQQLQIVQAVVALRDNVTNAENIATHEVTSNDREDPNVGYIFQTIGRV